MGGVRRSDPTSENETGADAVAVDISGRHEDETSGRYIMVCAAVAVDLNPNSLDSVGPMEFETVDTETGPSFEVVADTVGRAVEALSDSVTRDAVVVSEEGEFYNKPDWVVEGALTGHNEFKYVETIGERKAVDVAHRAAY
ncbi:MAG: DUF2209 family protein, partial [Halobacteria archaeon]|nr:DUF2209 family protein [Halobacteria archaeon]